MINYLLLCCLLLSFNAAALENFTVVDVYDGDTFFITVPGCAPVLCERVGVRLRGVDTPEIRGKCATEKQAARQAKAALLEFLSSGIVQLRNVERGKYYRILADVYVSGWAAADYLQALGLARAYAGGKRVGWC